MSILDTKEWFRLADQDFLSAKHLTTLFPMPCENICYCCSQATEKYLKGFLTYHKIIPPKTHNLISLIDISIDIEDKLRNIRNYCLKLNDYTNEIRYPDGPETDEETVEYLLNVVDIIVNHDVFCEIKRIIDNQSLF